MHVLVTGAAGYVGYSVVRELAANDAVSQITLYDNLSRGESAIFWGGLTDGAATFVKGEVLDERGLLRALDGVDAVVHLAAAVYREDRDADAHVFDQVNNWGTAQLVGAIERSPSVTTFVYLSSASVYGGGPDTFDIDDPPVPRSFYATTKLRGEEHAARLTDSSRTVHIVRAGNVFGFNHAMRFEGVINRFVFDAKHAGRVTIEGSGLQTRPFIEVGLLADAMTRLLLSDEPSATHNFVQDNASVLDLFKIVNELRPDLEALFVSQEMPMEELSVQPHGQALAAARSEHGNLDDGIGALWRALTL